MTCIEPILVSATIQENSCYCGLDLRSIPLLDNCILLGVIRAEELVLASAAEITVRCGDRVLALVLKPAFAPALKLKLNKTHPISWSALKCSLNWESSLLRLSRVSELCVLKDYTKPL